jgi:hypothetical protein
MKQTEKLASSIYFLKKADEAELNLLQTLQQAEGGIAGGLVGALAGGKAGLKFLPRLLKKMDLKLITGAGKSPFAFRNSLRRHGKELYDEAGADAGMRLGFGSGALGGYFGTGKLLEPSTQKLKENFQQIETATNELKEKIPNIENIKRLIKENPALAGGAGLAALLGGGYLASKALSGKEEEKEEEEQEE